MKKSIYCLLCFFLFTANTFASHFDWAQQILYSNRSHSPNSIACDKSGNIIVGGGYNSCIVCPLGFLEKRDSSGNFLWQIIINNQGSQTGISKLALDSAGNIYTAIFMSSWNDLSINGTLIPADGNSNMLAKFSPAGNLLWYTTVSDHGTPALAVDLSGNVFFTDGDTLRKYNVTGQLKWKQAVSGYNIEANGSDVFVAGTTSINRFAKSNGSLIGSYTVPSVSDFIVMPSGVILLTGDNGTYRINNGTTEWSSGIKGNSIARYNNSLWVMDAKFSQYPNSSFPTSLRKLSATDGTLLTEETLANSSKAGGRNLCVDARGNVVLALTISDYNKYANFPPYILWPDYGALSNGYTLARYIGESASPVLGFTNSVWDPQNSFFGYWNSSEIGRDRACPGSTQFSVGYTYRSGTLQAGNVVTVELSDAVGSFVNPTVIGAKSISANDGYIQCIVPSTLPNGSGYLMRIKTTNPVSISKQTSISLLVSSPHSTLSLSSASTTFCSGSATISVAPFNNNYFYVWQRNGNYVSSGSVDTIVKPVANGTYNCVLTDEIGCTRASDNSYSVKVLPLPNATISPVGNQEICSGSSLLLQVPNSASNNYVWYKGASVVGSNTANYTVSEAGNYKVTVTGVNGCSKTSSTVKTTVYTSSITAFGPTTFCAGDSVLLGANDGIGISYQWNKNNSPIPGANSRFYTAKQAGYYKVLTGNSNGCESLSSAKAVSINCRISDENKQTIFIYPNPVGDQLTIQFPDENSATVEIRSVTGQLVFQQEKIMSGGLLELNVSDLESGVYFITIQGAKGVFNSNFIKQ